MPRCDSSSSRSIASEPNAVTSHGRDGSSNCAQALRSPCRTSVSVIREEPPVSAAVAPSGARSTSTSRPPSTNAPNGVAPSAVGTGSVRHAPPSSRAIVGRPDAVPSAQRVAPSRNSVHRGALGSSPDSSGGSAVLVHSAPASVASASNSTRARAGDTDASGAGSSRRTRTAYTVPLTSARSTIRPPSSSGVRILGPVRGSLYQWPTA